MLRKNLWISSLSLMTLLVISFFMVWKMDQLIGNAEDTDSNLCPVRDPSSLSGTYWENPQTLSMIWDSNQVRNTLNVFFSREP
jgi:hypothetical protein